MPAHRRHLTIMSCDIVNSTVYADAMDPEDFEILMTNFFETSKAVVERHRGAFAHHTGDGFTAYFGSPRTQGRNAQEAIECGLAVVEALSRLTVGEGSRLLVRIGIATGLVVFSTINRQNNASDIFAVGASVHLAARIQALAAPGSVWVDSFTYDLAQRNFEFTDRGTHILKGFSEAKHVWEAGPPRALEFRFEERQEHLTPFVGRVREMQVLDECWRLVEQGTGQAALISGEPGIGKSRFVFEFIKRVASHPPLVFQCLEDHENEPLHPLINHMRHLAQIVLNEPIEERRRKAGKFLDESFPGLGLLRPVVLSLIAQDGDELDMQYDSNPAYKFDALRSTIVDLAVVLKGESSRIVVVEDVQWIDPSSEEVLTSLIERAHQLRMLVIATSRNEGTLSKASLPLKRLPIVRLSTVEAVNLANHVFKGMTIGETVLGSVVERSDGIPLYVEEMARAVSETVRAKGSETPDEQDGDQSSDGHMPIPDTLHGTLLARLDGLGEAGELAQIASVMGQEFDVKVLSKLAGWPAEALQRNLGTLVESGVVRVLHNAASDKLEFKHALIRQAAYNSLLKRDVVRLHSDLAHIYEQDFPDIKSTSPEMLAQHLTVSGRSLDAASLWLQAGLLAKDMGSTIEALARLDRCLRCLESTDTSPEGLAIRMRCQMVRGAVINAHFGPVEPSAQEALSEAVTLATALQDGEAMVDSLTSLSIVKYYAGDFSAAISVAKQMIDYGTEHNNERASTAGKVFAGMCHFATGQFQQARADFEEALALLGGGNERAEPAEVRALVYLANTLHILGKFAEAAQLSAVALELTRHRRALDHAVALGNSLYLYYMQGSLEQTRRAGTELAHLGAEKGLLMWYHHARFFLGWADAVDGDRAGLEMMEASMDRFRSAHELVEQTLFYGILAERYLAAGVRERALENVERGLALVNRLGERFFEAPLVRIKVKCLTGFSDAKTVTELAELSIRAEQLAKDNGALAWLRTESA